MVVHEETSFKPPIEATGPLFFVTYLGESLLSGPRGVWMDDIVLQSNPEIATVEVGRFRYRFIVCDKNVNAPPDSIPASIRNLLLMLQETDEKKSLGEIYVFAEAIEDKTEIARLSEEAIATKVGSDELDKIAREILTNSFKISNLVYKELRRNFGQYWLLHVTAPTWFTVRYYSPAHEQWFYFKTDPKFENQLMGKKPPEPHGHLFGKALGKGDKVSVNCIGDYNQRLCTFSEELIATSVVELGTGRLRSSILHIVIVLEQCATQALRYLIKTRIEGLDSVKTIDAISRELSLVALCRLVWLHLAPSEQTIDWPLIQKLYDTRNGIVHLGQRSLPTDEEICNFINAVWHFVDVIEKELQNPPSQQAPE